MSSDQSTICQKCQKQKVDNVPTGSLTSFMFQDMRCTCEVEVAPAETRAAPELDRCPNCERVLLERAGSFTSFLFQDLCCRCDEGLPVPRKKIGNGPHLLTRFQRTDSPTKVGLAGANRDWKRFDTEALVELKQNEIIGGYKLLEQIGRGGMGIVFLAEYLALNRTCALKFLAPSLVSDQSWIMFQNEAKIVAGLNHPTICQIYDMGVHNGRLPFYAMDYLTGESLESVLLKQRTLSVGAAVEVFLKVAEGLAYAHQHGVIHKDIKPANIMLTPGTDGQVDIKILDFGIAELVDNSEPDDDNKVSPNDVVGSTLYMSPEQLNGEKVDPRSDIYSIGCSLFETLTGETPFTGSRDALIKSHNNDEPPTLKQLTGMDFPEALEGIIKKALAKNPSDRYQSADRLAEDLGRLLAKKATVDEVPMLLKEPAEPLGMDGRVGVALVLVATGVCLGLGYLGVSFIVHSLTANEPTQSDAVAKFSTRKRSVASAKTRQSKTNQLTPMKETDNDSYYQDTLEKTSERYTGIISDAKSYVAAGVALAQVEDADPAIRNLEKGLRLNPKLWTPKISDELAKCYIDVGKFDQALAELNKGLEKEPDPFRYRRKGQLMCQLNRYDDAIKEFNKAISLGGDEYWCYFDRGCCYSNMNQNDKAIADFTKLISLRPDHAIAFSLRAKCYKKIGRLDLAKKDLAAAEKIGKTEMGAD